MTIDRRVLAGSLATLLLVAACGGSASQTPSTAPGASATPAAPSQEPTATPEPTQGGEPSVAPGSATDLEAKLPDEVNGVKFQKASFDGETVPGGIPIGGGNDKFATFLADNGKTLKDIKIAVATPADTASAAGSMVMAIQVEGVASDKLAEFATSGMTGAAKTTIGGKEVYGAAAAGFGAYVYVNDDVVYYVLSMGGDAAFTEGILQQLP